MATIGGELTEQLSSEVDLFGSMMLQNVIENEFNREYAPLATIQPNVAIEFTVKGANKLYLDLNNSRLHVLFKITKEDGRTSTRTQRLQSTWRFTQCFAKLSWS